MKKDIVIKKIGLLLFIMTVVCIIPGKVSADCIVGTGINVRKGPGTKYDKVTTISRDDKEIKVIAKTGEWSQIVLANGIEGYIKSSFLRQRSYMKADCTINVRSKPSFSDSVVIEKLKAGDIVAIIRYGIRTNADEANNHIGWYRIYNLQTGTIGWCVENFFTPLQAKKISYNTVKLRKGPGTSYSVLKVLNTGDNISLIEKNSSTGWSKIVSNGVIGYINNSTYKSGGEYVYTTTLTTHAGRNKNIAKAAGLINGKVLYAGQTFSYLNCIGEVTQAGGYFQAPEIINGQVVENETTFGGGICQVSSTLYNALRGFKSVGLVTILERRPHSTKAKYVPYNWDAMVSYNAGYDFKFRSTLNLKISAEVINSTPKRLTVKVESF